MEYSRLNLPVGIHTFERIRKEGYIYVDKTKYLVEMIRTGGIYFLARPRRFGKSLTVSTLEALFLGKKELFKGLYAEELMNREDFVTSPVIRLDMSAVDTDCGISGIRESMKEITIEASESLEVDVPHNLSASNIFRKLIINTARKYKQQAVILIDEYDAPYTEFVNDPVMADKVRAVLRDYYKQLKANEQYIRFIFITGISKFARFGVFSTLNNPEDISLMPRYSELCGYTHEEIIRYFPDYLEETAIEMQITVDDLMTKIRDYYNGFTFDRNCTTKLYNPFSTLRFLNNKEFADFWVESGRSKVIADFMKHRNLTVEEFRNFPISTDFARSPGDMDTTPPEGFLYQSGYLTLREGTITDLALDYPNTEVLNSMSALLSKNILTEKSYNYFQNSLLYALVSKSIEDFVDVLNRFLSCIPYADFSSAAKQTVKLSKSRLTVQEWLYRSNIISFLRGCGVVTFAEVQTSLGRPDILLTHQGHIWLVELKVAANGETAKQKAEEAFRQIEEKYAKAYPEAFCVALAIDDEKRQITEFLVCV